MSQTHKQTAFKFLLLFSTFVLSTGSITFAQGAPDWATYALRLSAESDAVTQKSIQNLKSYPRLDEKLTAALSETSTRSFLALDVIATLSLEKLVPVVISKATTDQSGFFYLCLNRFFSSSHRAELISLYQKRLTDRSSSPPVKMVLLDTLGRLKIALSESELRSLLIGSESPEVKSAALYYLRSSFFNRDLRYQKLWANLLKDKNSANTSAFNTQLANLRAELKKQGVREE